MALIVVSDTSPIRALAALGALAWLQELFGEVLVPPVLADELLHAPGTLTSVDVSDFPWMVIRSPANADRVNQLRDTLDAGESQAIALAEECRADWVLIDELAGRAVAGQSRLSVRAVGHGNSRSHSEGARTATLRGGASAFGPPAKRSPLLHLSPAS